METWNLIKTVLRNICFYIYKNNNTKPISLKEVSISGERISDEKRRLALFAHYNVEGYISDTDWKYLEALSKICDIIFISNSSINDRDKKILLEHKWEFIERHNIGFDFGAWKEAILRYKGKIFEYDELSLVNNSCYYPLYPLENIYRKMEDEDIDFWGITAFRENHKSRSIEARLLSMQKIPTHVQSYYLVFDLRKVKDCFVEFWEDYKEQESFVGTVEEGEIALTQFFINHGKTYDVYIKETLEESDCIYSPDLSKHQPEKLIAMGSPIIKKKSLSQITEKQYENLLNYLQETNRDLFEEVSKADYNGMISKTYRFLNKVM